MPDNKRQWRREDGTGSSVLDLDGHTRVRAKPDSYTLLRDRPDGAAETLIESPMPRITNITELRCFAERAAVQALKNLPEIHFHESDPDLPAGLPDIHGWAEGGHRVDTTQMGLLNADLFEQGYRLFVHPAEGRTYEICIGENDCTPREIRKAHNLFRMWIAGEFFLD